MHASFVTFCLLAVASAELRGYSYNRIGLPAPSSSILNLGPSIGGTASIAVLQQQPQQQPQLQQQHHQQLQQHIAPIGVLHQQPQLQQQQHHQQQQILAPIVSNEISKEFYTFSAPDEEFSNPQAEQEISSIAKKNVQVIFIHAPEPTGLNRVVQNLAQQTLEQQTAIYVLTKQADIGQLAQSFRTNVNRVVHKPEVHFVKYRTPQDAAQAQQSIRAQYDALGGSSLNSDEGVAPVLNFASAQQHSGGHGLSQGQVIASQPIQAAQIPQQPSQSYLPVGL